MSSQKENYPPLRTLPQCKNQSLLATFQEFRCFSCRACICGVDSWPSVDTPRSSSWSWRDGCIPAPPCAISAWRDLDIGRSTGEELARTGSSKHLKMNIENWKHGLNWSLKLQENNERKNTLVAQLCVLSGSWGCFRPEVFLRFKYWVVTSFKYWVATSFSKTKLFQRGSFLEKLHTVNSSSLLVTKNFFMLIYILQLITKCVQCLQGKHEHHPVGIMRGSQSQNGCFFSYRQGKRRNTSYLSSIPPLLLVHQARWWFHHRAPPPQWTASTSLLTKKQGSQFTGLEFHLWEGNVIFTFKRALSLRNFWNFWRAPRPRPGQRRQWKKFTVHRPGILYVRGQWHFYFQKGTSSEKS